MHYAGTNAIGVDVLDRRDEAGGAEDVGPGAIVLALHGVDRAIARDLVEGGGRFGREDDPESAHIDSGQLNRDQLETLRAHHIEHGGAIDLVDALQLVALLAMVGIGLAGISRFEGAGDIADAQAIRIERRIPVKWLGRDRHVQAIGTVDAAEYEGAILDRAAHGTDLVEAPAERHRAVTADAPVGGPQAGDAAAGRWRDDAAHGFGADGEADQASGDRSARASR